VHVTVKALDSDIPSFAASYCDPLLPVPGADDRPVQTHDRGVEITYIMASPPYHLIST
jgi:hypothetical protein